MAKNPKIYTRLAGFGLRTTDVVRLWLGPDHLLFVAASPLGERYKRFYFADIQAILLQKTASWIAWMIAWLVFAAIFGLIVLGSDPGTARIVFAVITIVFLVLLVIQVLLGPTCRCVIRTAVQTEELASLKRVRNADKVLARIRPLIESAQQSQPVENPAQI